MPDKQPVDILENWKEQLMNELFNDNFPPQKSQARTQPPWVVGFNFPEVELIPFVQKLLQAQHQRTLRMAAEVVEKLVASKDVVQGDAHSDEIRQAILALQDSLKSLQ